MIYQITEEQRQQLLNALKTRDLRLHDDCFWMLLALTPVDDHIGSVNKMVDEEEPVAYLAWRDGKPCYEGDDAVCEDAVWPVDGDDDRASMPVVTLASAQAAVAAQALAYETHYEGALDRITALEAALRQARDALDVATDSLGSFTMDHGSSQVDFDNIDTALAALCKLNQILK